MEARNIMGFTWSFSKLRAFEVCSKRFYHYEILKDVKEPESRALVEGAAAIKPLKSGYATARRCRCPTRITSP